MSIRRNTAFMVCGLALASASLAGCSSGSSTSSSSASPSPTVTTSGTPVPSFTGENAAFCNALVAAGQAGDAASAAKADGNAAEFASAGQSYVTALQQVADNLPSDVPADLKPTLDQAVSLANEQIAAGPSASPDPSASALGNKLNQLISKVADKACPLPSSSPAAS